MSEPRPEPVVLLTVAADGAVLAAQKLTAGSGWSPWRELGARVEGPVAAARNRDGELELFAVTSAGRLASARVTEQGGGWTGWVELPAAVRSAAAVHRGQDGRLELFAEGQNGRLGHIWQSFRPDGSIEWSDWHSFGVATSGPPSVFHYADGALVVFSIGPDGCLGQMRRWAEPSGRHEWSPWESLAVPVSQPPVVVRDGAGALALFAAGLDGILGCLQQRLDPGGVGQWSSWTTLGIEPARPVAAAWGAGGELHVFVTLPDGVLVQMTRDAAAGGTGEWSDPVPLLAGAGGAPSVIRHRDGELEVVLAGDDGQLCCLRLARTASSGGWTQEAITGRVLSDHPPTFHPQLATDAQALGFVPPPRDLAPVVKARSADWPVSVDVCVIGAGPAGITVTERLLQAGRSVMLVDSGGWNEDAQAQELSHGDADGEIIQGNLTYLRFGRRRQVQGAAAIWGGWCLPFAEVDLAARDWLPLSGWPLTREDLAPHELRAAETLGIDPFPPPGGEGELQRVSYHFPRNTLVFRAILAAMVGAPGLRLELETTMVGLEFEGDRVANVRLARLDGAERQVAAQTVILAGGGIENARILMVHESTLPVGLPMLGRCFMDHPHVRVGTLTFRDPGWSDSLRAAGRRQDVFTLSETVQDRERLLNATVQLRPSRRDPPLEAPETELLLRSEQGPNPDSRVTLVGRVDAFGWPRPYLQWLLGDDDWISIVRTAELIAERLETLDGTRVELRVSRDRPWPEKPAGPGFGGGEAWGNHHIGTTRIAPDPSTGVVDSDCRVHGTTNLYIAGSSVFPTSGAANPTFMLVALAHRLADHLAHTIPSGSRGRSSRTAAR